MNERIKLNEGWLFHDGDIAQPTYTWKGPAYSQAKTERCRSGPAAINYPDTPDDYSGQPNRVLTTERWERVLLPHDYIISQEPQEKLNNALGFFDYHPAWYRRHMKFTRDDEAKRLVLYFEGVTDHCEVFFNGCPLFDNRSGFVPFEVDITDYVRFDVDNVLAVHVIPGLAEGWWYSGAGIYRNVWLEKSEKAAVERFGVYIAPKKNEDGSWTVPVETELRNNVFTDETVRVVTELKSADGTVIADGEASAQLPARENVTLRAEYTVSSPALWDVDDPNLYTCVTTVYDGETPLDRQTTTFGFRTLRFDAAHGFFLNDRHLKIKGVCGHGDFGLTGKAVPKNILSYKAGMIKEMGANAYRCSHYPQPESFMDDLDRLGIMVMDETRWFASSADGKDQLRTLIRRDRNHPSIIMWSVGNEEPSFITEYGARIAETLVCEVKKLDKTRPVMVANDKTLSACTVYEKCDIIGVNYNLNMNTDALHEKYPDKPIVSSECCATGTTRGWYFEDSPEHAYISAYDGNTNSWFGAREMTWKFMCEREWMMGSFQWIAFEHRGEAVWPRLCSQSGAIDLYLQRKDAFWQNQSHWSDKPMIHLLPHWNFAGHEGEIIKVWAYTNCEEAELFLDGESLGRQKLNRYDHAAWEVAYRPGRIKVVGYIGGEAIVSEEKITSGRAAKLCLTPDNLDTVRCNGEDVLLVTCSCADENGLPVPDASTFVRFSTNAVGRIIGTGSDISDHTPVTLPDRRMRAGAITVAIRLGKTAGKLKLIAESDTLTSAVLTVDLA